MNLNSKKKLETDILNFIDRYNLISEGDKILLGLSGGPDSVFALHFFIKYLNRLKIELSCIHINHKLRGNESDEDENFVRKLCEKKKIDLIVRHADAGKYSLENDYSVEEAARHLRYREFMSGLSESGSSKIVTAHNCNDNTETVFINTVKGTGLSGYAGIPVIRDNIIRPFLAVTKSEILDYLNNEDIEFRKDSSNYSTDFQRNYLRINIIPELENNINPSIHKSMLNTSLNLHAALNILNSLIESILDKHVTSGKDSVELTTDISDLANEYIFGEVLKRIFTGHLQIEFNRKLFNQLTELKSGQPGRQAVLESGWTAIRERSGIRFLRRTQDEAEQEAAFNAGESVELCGIQVGCEFVDGHSSPDVADENTEFISADNLNDKFILRKWKNGDKFQPLGMKGTKKISDFLTEQKVPSGDKSDVLVLTNNETIVWVVGLRISEKFKLTENTKRAAKLWKK